MKRSKFTESQIVFALKQAETGVAVAEVCRKMGISEATFYNWKKKYGGLGPDELRRLRQLEEENSRLKQIVAGSALGQADAPGRVKRKALRSRQRRQLANVLLTDYRVSERRACGVVVLSRSVYLLWAA